MIGRIMEIESWKTERFYMVMIYEDFTDDPTDLNWYLQAFQKFKEERKDLQYATSYFIPGRLLQ
jgi:hypothetical protein